MRVRTDEIFNISMSLMDGEVRPGGIWGLRVDYWDEDSSSYPPEASLFFYDTNTTFTVSDLSTLLSSTNIVTVMSKSFTAGMKC